MTPCPPVAVVHGLDDALRACRAALRHRRPLLLASGGYLAWAGFAALLQAARDTLPEAPVEGLFDPGGRAGAAAEALHGGARLVILPADHPQRDALAALAAACGARLCPPPAAALDLARTADAEAALDALLADAPPAAQPLPGGGEEG